MNELEQLENKYINLIVNRCINFCQAKALLIQCDFKEHIRIAEKIKETVNKMGILDVCININDLDEIHNYLKDTKLEEIKLNPLIDRSNWDRYAIKGAPIIFLTSEVPGLMNDITPDKIKTWVKLRKQTTKYYSKNVCNNIFPWTIMALPNERWAKLLFPDDKNAYEKLYLNILKMCMVDTEDPITSWNNYINENNVYKNKLNDLKITSMHYTNSLGTDLYLEKPADNIWHNMDGTDAYGNQLFVNMPSYEIFTSPNKYRTNGVVVSSRILEFNGTTIDGLKLTFENGKIITVEAKKGREVIEKALSHDKNARFLGEVALVPHNSPISNTGIIFHNTLFDENASCHLAWGDAFPECVPDFDNRTDKELEQIGFNQSVTHTDFMIGTSDLNIEADTREGKKLIFKNGNFNI